MSETIFHRITIIVSLFVIHVTSGFVQLPTVRRTKNNPRRETWSPAFATVFNSTVTTTSREIAPIRTKNKNKVVHGSPKRTNTRRTTKDTSFSTPSINDSNIISHSTAIGTIASSSTTPSKKNKSNNKRNFKDQEFSWLHWVYNQWKNTAVGGISDENVIKQMMKAIPKWSKRKSLQDAERAEELLERLIQEAIAGNPLMRTKTTTELKESSTLLSVTLFNAAMDAYAKIGNPEGVQRILRRMEFLRTSVNNTNNEHNDFAHLHADEFSMSTLATAWAKNKNRSVEAAQKAEAILQYMYIKDLVPNTITYNTVLHAIAVGNQCDRALRAEDIVQRMIQRHEDNGEDCMPDVYTYQSLIQAWSRTSLPGAPQKAEEIIQSMDEDASSSMTPNAYCFTTVIHSWARSSEKHRARRAYQLLNVLTRRYNDAKSNYDIRNTKKNKKLINILKPNVKTFTSVLNACALPVDESEKDDAFAIAQLTMEELSVGIYGKPNFLSFAAYLAVCGTTLDAGSVRDAEVKKTFEDCIKAGQVGQIVLEKLHVAASPALLHQLIGSYLNVRGTVQIPPHWNALTKGERTGGNYSVQVDEEDVSKISKSSQQRLKDVQKFGGKSGIISSFDLSSTVVGDGEDEIIWSNDEFSSWGATR